MIALFPAREIFLTVGRLNLYWYGLLYLAAFYLAWRLLPRLQHYRDLKLTRDDWLLILTAGIAGVVLGGRLGYVVFYDLGYFREQPGEIWALWQGGMSAHGGFIGVALTVWLAARHLKVDLLRLADVMVVPVALGLALGRVGNWINGELYVSDLSSAVAVAKNLLIAGACYYALRKIPWRGGGLALFLVLYGTLRFLTEYWRQQPWELIFGLTRGQALSLPILAAGVLLVIWLRYNSRKASA